MDEFGLQRRITRLERERWAWRLGIGVSAVAPY